jgi:hypothetical protein
MQMEQQQQQRSDKDRTALGLSMLRLPSRPLQRTVVQQLMLLHLQPMLQSQAVVWLGPPLVQALHQQPAYQHGAMAPAEAMRLSSCRLVLPAMTACAISSTKEAYSMRASLKPIPSL